MARSALAVGSQTLVEFTKPGELDEMKQRPARLPLELWEKMDAIAKKQAAEGRISPYTRRAVSANDVLRKFIEMGLALHEAEHGPVRIETPAEPAKKKPAKKGGK